MDNLSVSYLSPGDLRPYESNSRTHSTSQVRKIADSIQRFGFVNPILADESKCIIAGHGRHAAALLLGLEKVPVILLVGLSESEKKALVIADNKLTELGGWDQEKLKAELDSIKVDFDLGDLGFAQPDLERLFAVDFSAFSDEETSPEESDEPEPEKEEAKTINVKGNLVEDTRGKGGVASVVIALALSGTDAEIYKAAKGLSGLTDDKKFILKLCSSLTSENS